MTKDRQKIYSLALSFLVMLCILQFSNAANAYSAAEVAERAKPATVGIYASLNTDKYYGTGIIISSDGHILTSTTVVPENSDTITVYFEDHTFLQAEVIETSEQCQSVLLKVKDTGSRTFPFLPLNQSLPSLGEDIYTLGNANNMIKLGDGVSFSAGVVSGIYKLKPATDDTAYTGTLIETDASVNDGQDGGGLINSLAEVVGVISKDFSPLRWQGTSIPIQEIIQNIDYLNSDYSKAVINSTPSPSNLDHKFTTDISRYTDSLVAINVHRLYPAETLHFPKWNDYKQKIGNWDSLPHDEQRRLIVDFFSTKNLVAANQMLRRPSENVTGIIISPEGHILTSAFNVESADSIYLDPITKGIKQPEYQGSIEDLTANNLHTAEHASNRVVGIEITINNNDTVNAEIIGFNLPLGLALLKIDYPTPLPFLEIASNLATPVLGEDIALLGKYSDTYTINTGIISAAERDNGNYFQTDALLNYGNSGGPIINEAGKFLGLATRPLTPSPLSGAILPFSNDASDAFTPTLADYTNSPNSGISMGIIASKINQTLPEMLIGKGITQSKFIHLGISPERDNTYASTIIVGNVEKNSPASIAGFQKGDIIKNMDGIGIRSWKEINQYIAQKKAGQVVVFTISRPLEPPYLLLNGKKVDSTASFKEFVQNYDDNTILSARVLKPAIEQKIYVSLDSK